MNEEPKPTRNKTAIIAIILTILLAASITGNVIQFIIAQNPASNPNNQSNDVKDDDNTPAPTSDTSSAQQYISSLRPYITELNGNYEVVLNYGESAFTIVNADDYDFFSSTEGYSASSPTPSEEHQPDLYKLYRDPKFYEKITTKLQSDGFKSSDTFEQMGIDVRLYTTDKIICNVPILSEYDTADDGLYLNIPDNIITCADKSAANKKMQDMSAFVEAYRKKENKSPDFLAGNISDVKDSAHAPYQNIILSFIDAAALFYRASSTSDWAYFTGTQAALSCSDYNTDDLKKAYLGETCYTDDGESKVSL